MERSRAFLIWVNQVLSKEDKVTCTNAKRYCAGHTPLLEYIFLNYVTTSTNVKDIWVYLHNNDNSRFFLSLCTNLQTHRKSNDEETERKIRLVILHNLDSDLNFSWYIFSAGEERH
jgi:hypothetical protein